MLLLLLSSLFYACSGETSLNIPAVVGDGGSLVNVSMRLVPGDGGVFVSTNPRTGMDTQTSIEQAVGIAKISNPGAIDSCDVLITFGGDSTGRYIEGPSAGAAMTVMAYSLLNNGTIRDDTVITGTITPDGNIGAVGGLYEKARAAAFNGADYFITPPNSFYEMLILRNMEEKYGVTVLQARNINELIGFMLFNQSIHQEKFSAGEINPPDVEPYTKTDVSVFTPVSDDMLILLNNTIQRLKADDEESKEVKKFFENQLQTYNYLLENNYPFSAANGAFLDYIEISTIVAILDDEVNIENKKSEITSCLESIERPEMNEENFQWVIGSELRDTWARNKLNKTNGFEPLLVEEKYVTYHELMYADAWCHVSHSLANTAPIEGEKINESMWKGLANDMLERADQFTHSPDTQDRLDVARRSYDEGKYGAAIFDAVFVFEMDSADLETEVLTEEELANKVDELSNEKPNSLWGKVYHTQGVFIVSSGGSNASAYRILRLAKGLDIATSMMALELQENKEKPEPDPNLELIIYFGVLMFLIFVVVLYTAINNFVSRGSDGNNNKRRNQANRIKQKNGRARIPPASFRKRQ